MLVPVFTVLLALSGPGHSQAVSEVAKAQPRPAGAPRPSDVCFSSRWPRPLNAQDTHDTFAAARAFHATRLDWVYAGGNKDFTDRAHALGYTVGGAVNSTLTDAPGSREYLVGRGLDLAGNPITPPWMRSWGAVIGCSNSPDYRRIYLDHARQSLDTGVDRLQVDDPMLGDVSRHWGGCFCEHCIAGFRQYLARAAADRQPTEWGITDPATFDYAAYLTEAGTKPGEHYRLWRGAPELRDLYRAFQVEGVLDFHREARRAVDAHAGRHVPYSCNGSDGLIEYLHEVMDFGICESYPHREGQPELLYRERLRPLAGLGKPLVFTFVSDDVPLTRRFIALSSALGAHVIVPWDVYTGSDSPRVFGTPDQYADLYGFIRANATWIDGYEEAAVAGPTLTDDRYADAPPVRVDLGHDAYAVTRARPGEPESPVVVHLVDWATEPEPFRVTLDPSRLFGDRALKVSLLAPAPYDAEVHEQAEANSDFSKLAVTSPLTEGRTTMVEVPPLKPWGMLIIQPMDEEPGTPWQPTILAEAADYYREALRVRLACCSPDAETRYTLDGSEPTAASSLYEEPIRLTATTTVSARAFDGGGQSALASATFTRIAESPQPTPPATGTLSEALVLWLRADVLADALGNGDPVEEWPADMGPTAAVPNVKLLTGEPAAPPTFVAEAIAGQPAVRFDGVDDLLAIPGFANEQLAGHALTAMLVTRSEDDYFGISGNALSGSGGEPRLYLTRSAFHYDKLSERVPLPARPGEPAILTYLHDGGSIASAFVNGERTGSRADLPVVEQFGGGHLAMPFWSGSLNHAGEIAEVILYGRALTDAERVGIEEHLAQKYAIPTSRKWR